MKASLRRHAGQSKRPERMNRRIAQSRRDGFFAIRIFHRTRNGRKDARFLFKCGCCDERLELHYGEDSLEINGVFGSVDNWRKLLLPLLERKLPGQGSRSTSAKSS